MTKTCEYNGCTQEVPAWATYCPTHYQMLMKQQQQQHQHQNETNELPVLDLPQMPEIESVEEKPKEQHHTETRMMPELPKMEMKKESKPSFELPEVDEKTRIEVKKIAFTGALQFLITQDLGDKPYDQVIEELRTLTSEFYKIVIEKNEESKN